MDVVAFGIGRLRTQGGTTAADEDGAVTALVTRHSSGAGGWAGEGGGVGSNLHRISGEIEPTQGLVACEATDQEQITCQFVR